MTVIEQNQAFDQTLKKMRKGRNPRLYLIQFARLHLLNLKMEINIDKHWLQLLDAF
jgi:hypothetical protein